MIFRLNFRLEYGLQNVLKGRIRIKYDEKLSYFSTMSLFIVKLITVI